ncbi:unnamed protein product [Rotaria sp. Silwood1]|nr:unnamed protein product [Rotaria sp. Silwood1]CAF1665158.1 unnamed protein product [Rotaria sp. Silwood1]CAF3861241.1 unnamed protein product [Rotaria sp. Silwood1]CAF3903485.1 unnamed protein product [Rotaria sp. Silwood1]CAF5003830.1 unnamed protein product [Rotaria sp. Silwood1]
MQSNWNSFLLAIIIIASIIKSSKQYVINQNQEFTINKLEYVKIEKGNPGFEREINRHRNHSIHRPNNKHTQDTIDTGSTSNILYHFSSNGAGGLVLTGPTKVYVIFYGTWTSTQINPTLVFISNIGSTSWYNIEKTYYSQATSTSSQLPISGPLTLGGAWTLSYIFGTSIQGTNIPDALKSYITSGALPNDPHGLYLWLTSPDVIEKSPMGGQFKSDYCGYHVNFMIGNTPYFYGFIGNPGKTSGTGCDPSWINSNVSPNGDIGVDAMVSCIGHEIVEAVSDALGDAWFDSDGEENADKW